MLAIMAALPFAAGAAELSGSVTNADGDPVTARITIRRGPPNPGIETHRTDERGRFSIETPSRGIIAVSASANGYASHEVSGGHSSLRFVLRELMEVEGRVRDSNGAAPPGTEVQVRYVDSERHLRLDDGMTAITDGDGEFVVAAAPGQGRFVVDAFADNWVPQSSAVLGNGSVGSTGVGGG